MLDDDSFEFPLDMTSRQYFNVHARLYAERDRPHRHRRLHRNEEEWLAKELRIPLAQLHSANASGGMFDLTRLPSDERERREKSSGLPATAATSSALARRHLDPMRHRALSF